MGRFTPRIRRVGTDRYRIAIPDVERDVLASLVRQMRELLVSDDPALRRLFPTAYANDPERDAGYHALVRDELIERRFASLDTVEATLDSAARKADVDDETLSAWMRSLNDLRLVLGTRLDVGEDDDPEAIDPEDPEAPAWGLYHYLGMMVSFIVDALASDLGPGDDAGAPDDSF